MLFRQYLDKEPVIAVSYLFGCPTKGVGAVVDPIGDVGRYLREASEGGVPIRYVFDTHMHADHLSPGRELAGAAGAEYVLLAGTETTYVFKGVEDVDILHMGNTEVEVLHTPGHTPEHISLVVTDHARAEEPWLVLTGHTLMVSDMGRTELATSTEEGARALFRSAARLRRLPDHLSVFPGAFSGSAMRSRAQREPELDDQLRAPVQESEAEFVQLTLDEIPAPPPNAARIRATNLGLDPAAI